MRNIKGNSFAIYSLLILISCFAAYLRFRSISLNSLWLDELYSITESNPQYAFLDVYHRLGDVHPPLYQIALWGLYNIIDYGEFVGRYFSAILGVILIPAIFLLARKLFLSAEVGLISAFFAALNYFLVWYSQETRSYELLALLTTVSFFTFVGFLREPNTRNTIFYAVSTAALANTHFFGFLPILSQTIVILYVSTRSGFNGRLFSRAAAAGGFIVLSIVPMVPGIMSSAAIDDFWISIPRIYFMFSYFVQYFGGFLLASIFSGLCIIGLISLFRDWRHQDSLIILAAWCLIGLVVPYVYSVLSIPILTPRNTIIMVPMILVVSAFGVSCIESRFIKVSILVAILIYSVIYLVSEKRLYSSPNKQQWREVVERVIDVGGEVPVYASWSEYYNTYFKLLGSDISAKDIKFLDEEMSIGQSPSVFHILDAHDMHFSNHNFQKKYNAVLIDRVLLLGASMQTFKSNKGAKSIFDSESSIESK